MNYIEEYHKKIQSGEIVVGEWIKRFYDYLIKGLNNKSFYFVEEKANKVIDWIEHNCYHTEGPLAPNPLKLELWQKSTLSVIYGVVDEEEKRQFREIVLIMARKNGKSLFASAIARYEWMNGGYGSRIYCLAPKLDQTDIIYNSIWQQTLLSPEYQQLKAEVQGGIKYHERKTVDDSELPKHRMTDLYIAALNSTVKKIAFSERKSDGFNPSLTICDEIACWEGDRGLKMYEVMKSGMGAREMGQNPSILLSCSTSGYIENSIYDEIVLRSSRFLLGDSKETKLAPFLYIIDDIDKWNDIEELRKSNPNLGVSVSEKYLQEEMAVAEMSISKKSEFITKYCCLKQNSSLAWLSAQTVGKMCGEELHIEDFAHSYCVVGIDLSQTTDLTAAVVLIQKDGEIYVFAKFWLPSQKIDEAVERDGIPYHAFIQRGLLEPSGDNFIDYHDCFNWLTGLVEQYEILPLVVGYDRYCAQYLVQDMQSYGFRCSDVFQGDNLWVVLQEMEGLFKDGKVHIGNNDLLKIHLLNSAIKFNEYRGRGRLIKLHKSDHIDGTAALADAFCVRQHDWAQIGSQLLNEDEEDGVV